MIKKWNSWFLLFFCLCFLTLLGGRTTASETLLPKALDNLSVNLRRSSSMTATSDGYMRVFCQEKEGVVYVEYYDDSFQIKSRKKIPMELDDWGGFYEGSDAYYLIEGQANTAESDTAEVIRVIQYDKNWKRIKAANITGNPDMFGGEVRYPFDYGCVEAAEVGGDLYIVTGHEGYVDEAFNQGHQGFLMIKVDTAAMTGQIVDADLWHSFAQYIKSRGNQLYVLEQSEGSRFTKLSRYNTDTMDKESLNVLQYGGIPTSAWAIACYASVDGMELSGDHVLCVGTSIDQSKYDQVSKNPDMAHNIYLTVTPMNDFSEGATKVKWLTNYKGGSKAFMGVKITKIHDNRFMISWEENDAKGKGNSDDSLSQNVLHYVFVDGKGDKISQEYTTKGPVSECQPIVKNGKIVYYASNKNMVNFYSIDGDTGAADQKSYRVAGDNVSWELAGDTLIISGTGEMLFDSTERTRYPVSNIGGMIFSEANPWGNLTEKVKKIVVKGGVTKIPERAFAFFDDLEEVVLKPGVKSIGKEAFYECDNLDTITIPSSVTHIGEDILWTGYTWIGGGHVTSATILAPHDSYAARYAKKNGISYKTSLSEAKVSGVKTSYVYTGKDVKPRVTVKIGNTTLKEGQDYDVSYKNQNRIGKASLTVNGKGIYSGSLTVTYKLVPPKKGTKLTDSKTKNQYVVTSSGAAVAFKGAKSKNITSVNIPKSVKINGVTYKVTSIGDNAFKNYKKLKRVVISGNVKNIGTGAFQGCTALQSVKMGASVQSVGIRAFYGCKKLESAVLGKNVRIIGSLAFGGCSALKKLTIPAKVEKIGSKAFMNCTKLTSLTIQSTKLNSKKIGGKAFTNLGKSGKNISVRVPKQSLKTYKKLLRSRGLSAKARVAGIK